MDRWMDEWMDGWIDMDIYHYKHELVDKAY